MKRSEIKRKKQLTRVGYRKKGAQGGRKAKREAWGIDEGRKLFCFSWAL
jgi:hypothetical protein